jgi:hypothetical protein
MRWPTLPVALTLALAACGGAPARPAAHAGPPPAPPLPPTLPATDGAPPVLARGELDGVLDGGLGRFLGRVDTAPVLERGRFVGFRLTRLDPPLDRGGVHVGDVLCRVNGLPIERPEQALVAWDSLRVASSLTLEILRGGARNELRIAIVD